MLQPGDILRKRYQILQPIGRGGMADVYLAFDRNRQRQVAVKVLRSSLARHEGFMRSFSDEARSLVRLRHPNIVPFYALELDHARDLAFIVMAYIDGHSLRTELAQRRSPLTLFEATYVLAGVAAALHHAHQQGFVHRDVKPGNVLLARDGRILLTDFGIAQAADRSGALTPTMGTPAYMSPEQILGQRVDHRGDIYSLGVTLYEMVTYRRPFTGGEAGLTSTSTAGRVREAHLRLAPPDPTQYNPRLPQAAGQVILRAMAKDPAQRWPDAAQMDLAWTRAVEAALNKEPHTLRWASAPLPSPTPEPTSLSQSRTFSTARSSPSPSTPPSSPPVDTFKQRQQIAIKIMLAIVLFSFVITLFLMALR